MSEPLPPPEIQAAREWRRCAIHPDVDGSRMWGCPDCLVELRRERGEIQAARLDAARKMRDWYARFPSRCVPGPRERELREIIGEWEVSAQREEQPSADAAQATEPPASPMSPRAALLVAVRNVWEVATDRSLWGTDDALLGIISKEARRVLLTDWQEDARRYAQNADYWRKRCEEAYADAARIAREWPREGTGAGTDDLASSTIARAIEARAREVAEGGEP